jgi:hypothetical protein
VPRGSHGHGGTRPYQSERAVHGKRLRRLGCGDFSIATEVKTPRILRMSEPLDFLPPEPTPAGHSWARTTLWVSVVFLLVGAGLFVFKSCVEAPERIIRQAGSTLATVAAAFNRGAVSNAFFSYATTLTNNLNLQVATLNEMEVFTRQEVPLTAFGYIPLPDVVVEARAPVQYTYFLDLNAQWRFVLENNLVHVYAPPLRFNTPAVDASTISYEVKKGVLRTDDVLENLKRSISSLVVLRAQDNLPLVRETGRKQVAEFVQTWLMRSFADGKEFGVKAHFEGDPPADSRKREGFPFE